MWSYVPTWKNFLKNLQIAPQELWLVNSLNSKLQTQGVKDSTLVNSNLEHLQRCSVCDPAHKKWMNKSQHLPVWLRQMVLAQHNSAGCRGWRKARQRCAPAKKSVINMIWLLLSVSDRPITMIAPGGLLLVIPHLFAVPVSVYWWDCKRVNN